MNGPLHGIRVVECVTDACPLPLRLAIALAGRMAADLGATVAKLGTPQRDPVRSIAPLLGGQSALSAFLDQNKSYQAAEDPVSALLGQPVPEVILCNADADELLGDYGTTAVRTVLSMFGGTAAHPVAASEFTVMAASGLLDLVGDPEREPLRMGGHQLAYSCGLSAYAGTIAALTNAKTSGKGERVEVTLADVAVWLNWKSVAATDWSGDVAARARLGRDAEWQVVRCADGWVALVYLEADWPVLREFVGAPCLFESRFDERAERRRQARFVSDIIEAKFRQLTRAQLKEVALSKRLPLGPVWSPCELETDPQNVARGFFSRIAQPVGAPLLMPRLPILWNGAALQGGVRPAAVGAAA